MIFIFRKDVSHPNHKTAYNCENMGETSYLGGGTPQYGAKRLNRRRNVSIGGETSHIGGETSHIGGETSSVVAKRLTGGRNVLNWDKSSRRRGRNVLKVGAKRLGGETSMVRNVLEPSQVGCMLNGSPVDCVLDEVPSWLVCVRWGPKLAVC